MDQDPEAIKRDIEQTRERMGETVEALTYKTDVPARAKDAVSDRVEDVKGAISDAVDSAKSALGGAAAGAQTRAGDAITGARSSADDAVAQARTQLPSGNDAKKRFETIRSLVVRNPLGLAIGSIAAGLLVGLLLPISDVERDQVGPLGEQIVDNAKSTLYDAIEEGRTAITQAVGEVLNPTQPQQS
jgi:ElaB/YqjD/DUF883 family membrane-anchored ribosome-binding protein